MRENRRKHANQAIFPVKLRILPDMVFNKRAPIVIGVHVEAGLLREGTPICVPSRDNALLGRVFSIESNHKAIQEARTGQEVCIRIDPVEGEAPKLYGRHFDHTDLLISKVKGYICPQTFGDHLHFRFLFMNGSIFCSMKNDCN